MKPKTMRLAEKAHHHPRATISLIESNLPGWGVDLYIGGSDAAADMALLDERNIKAVLNCAVNLDIDLVKHPKQDVAAHLATHGSGHLRYYKLGLIDGAGNPDMMMLAGYHLLRSILDQELPDKPSYPLREKGNVLVNCRGGRSRSVALVSLFLHLELPEQYPTLEAAIAHVRQRRELHADEWFETPKPELVHIAERAAAMTKLLSDAGYGKAAR
jgi:dual specificity phosphatase 3